MPSKCETCENVQTSEITQSQKKERAYSKQVTRYSDIEIYCGKKFRKDEIIFAAYFKIEKREAKILVVAESDFAYTSKSLFWPDVNLLAAIDVDMMQ